MLADIRVRAATVYLVITSVSPLFMFCYCYLKKCLSFYFCLSLKKGRLNSLGVTLSLDIATYNLVLHLRNYSMSIFLQLR